MIHKISATNHVAHWLVEIFLIYLHNLIKNAPSQKPKPKRGMFLNNLLADNWLTWQTGRPQSAEISIRGEIESPVWPRKNAPAKGKKRGRGN